MIPLDEARRVAGDHLSSKLARWATDTTDTPVMSLPLKPPLEREVRANELVAETWVREWSDATLPRGAEVEWEWRSWRSIGRQRVPVRLRFHDADAVASFAGSAAARDWRTMHSRVETLRKMLGASDALDAAIRRHATEIRQWPSDRFDQVVTAVDWLSSNSVRGLRPRQMPIRGVDTKWFKSHRAVLTALHAAVTGSVDLGIVDADRLVRIRILDPSIAPGGVSDFAAAPIHLAALPLRPYVVFVFENLESVLAMPSWPGAVVVHGSGYAVGVIGDLPWVRRAHVVYWGDLDSDGFAILHRLRTRLPNVVTALMDEQTLMRHRDLWVPEPKPSRTEAPKLSPSERAALQRLRDEGNVRLEQERIPWAQALTQLQAAVPRADR